MASTPKLKSGLRSLPLTQLHEAKDNPRSITDEAMERLKRAVSHDPEMLRARPLVATPNGEVICGNMRLRALNELGTKRAPVYVAELTPERRREWMLRDNNEYGQWVPDEVTAMLQQARADDADLALFGFDDQEVDSFLASAEGDQAQNPDRLVEPPGKATTKKGDLWLLGDHRLLCGDSSRADDVSRARGNGPPALMVTDPPYGVKLDHGWRLTAPLKQFGRTRAGKMEGDAEPPDWTTAYELSGAAVAYVWHGALLAARCAASLEAADYELRSQIIWRKDQFALSRGHYHWMHEPCWYAVKRGKTANWKGGRKLTTIWDAPSPIQAYSHSDDDAKTEHPSQKPLLVYERAIRNHLPRGGQVYDAFGGSGTCVIAAERTDRKAVVLELEPRWCDAIVQRWEELSGGKAKREKA